MSTAAPAHRKARPRLPSVVSKTELARLLDVSLRHIQRLASSGVVVRSNDGYDLGRSLQGYLAHREAEGRRRLGTEAEAALRDARSEALQRKMAREDRALVATSEMVDGIDLVVGVFRDTLDDLAVRFARRQLPDMAPVLAAIRVDLERKRAEVIARLERGAP